MSLRFFQSHSCGAYQRWQVEPSGNGPRGEYHRDKEVVDDDLGDGEDGEGHHDVDGIRWREGGGREELWNELVCSTHSLHRLPEYHSLFYMPEPQIQ